MRRLALPITLVGLLLVMSVSGCSLFGSGGGSGQLAVFLTDSPVDSVDAVRVTIGEVQVNREGFPPETVVEKEQTFDLLQLQNGAEKVLGQATLPEGHYNQIRLIVKNAQVVIGDKTYDVFVPSGAQTGIKLNVDCDVRSGTVAQILLDFDVRKSLTETPAQSGNYTLNPVIRAVNKADCGYISGTVTPVHSQAEVVVLEGLEEVASTIIDPTDGSFKVIGIPAGTYAVQVLADGYKAVTKDNIIVEANQPTELGEIVLEP